MIEILKSYLRPLKRLIQPKLSRQYKLAESWLRIAPDLICIDIGASYFPHGKWSLLQSSPQTTWVSVDPNSQNLAYVDRWSWPSKPLVIKEALSQNGGEQTLYVTSTDSGSSLLEPKISENMLHRSDADYFFPFQKQYLKTITLQDVIHTYELTEPVLIKLDTQGTELSILKGLDLSIIHNQLICVELETTLLAKPFYEGCDRFYDVQKFMEDAGFELVIFEPIMLSKPQTNSLLQGKYVLNECDSVFMLRPDLALKRSLQNQLALLGCYITYKLYGEALNLASQLKERASSLNASIDIVKSLRDIESLLS